MKTAAACPKVTGPITMQGRKSTWPQRTERVYAASYQSNMRRNDTIQSVAHVTNVLIWPSQPHSFHIGLTMGLGENEESTTMTSTADLRRKPRLP